jgi:hypothetical protein
VLIEENTGIPVDELLQRRSVFRVLYILLFCKQSSPLATFANLHKRGFVNVVSYTVNSTLMRRESLGTPEQLFNQNFETASGHINRLFEARPQRPIKLGEVALLVAHPSLPILCQASGADLHFVFTKTMTVVQSLSLQKGRTTRFFSFDPASYKFLVIDSSGTAFVYKFTVDFERVELVRTCDAHRYVSGAFFKGSTCAVFTTEKSEFVVFDLIWKKLQPPVASELPLADSRLEFAPDADCLVVVHKSKGSAWRVSSRDFSSRGLLSSGGDEILCFVIHKWYLLVGMTGGVLKVVSLRKMSVVVEQVFDEPDGKRSRVDQVAVCSDFVVVGLGNGTVSIVNKL